MNAQGRRANTLMLLTAILALLLVALASGSQSTQAQGGGTPAATGAVGSLAAQYAGRIGNSEAFIGIAQNGTQVTAYVCDGFKNTVSVAQWFKGSITADSFEASAAGGFRLEATFNQESFSGSVTLKGGQMVSFTASKVAFPAGLFRAEFATTTAQYVAGWIVLPTGEQRGAVINKATGEVVPSTHITFGGNG